MSSIAGRGQAMSDHDHEHEAAKGLALAAMALSFATIALLSKSGRLTKIETDDLFQEVLETLESMPGATGPAVGIARQQIDRMARIAATHGTLSPKSDPAK